MSFKLDGRKDEIEKEIEQKWEGNKERNLLSSSLHKEYFPERNND